MEFGTPSVVTNGNNEPKRKKDIVAELLDFDEEARKRNPFADIGKVMREDINRGIGNVETSRKPSLDDYDRRVDNDSEGKGFPYQGRYGKYENNDK